MDYSVLIPVYNSSASLTQLMVNVHTFFTKMNASYEIVLVDDCSNDHTWNVVDQLCKQYDEVKAFQLRENRGQQYALYYGLHHCKGKYVITIDDDLQHDIVDVMQLINKSKEGCDLVFGVYETYGQQGTRSLGSKIIGQFFKKNFVALKGQRVSSFRLIHESLYRKIINNNKSFIYLSAELLPHSKKVGNANVTRYKRPYGNSGYTLKKCIRIGLLLNIYYGSKIFKPLRKVAPYEAYINGWSR